MVVLHKLNFFLRCEFGHASRKTNSHYYYHHTHIFVMDFDEVLHKVSLWGGLITSSLGDQIKSEDLKEKKFKQKKIGIQLLFSSNVVL